MVRAQAPREARAVPTPPTGQATEGGFPAVDELTAFRAVLEGFETRAAVERFAPRLLGNGASARAVIGRVRRALQQAARDRGRPDLVDWFDAAKTRPGTRRAGALTSALDELRIAPARRPLAGDSVTGWLSTRAAAALERANIKTLAAVAVRAARSRRWWTQVPGLGQAGARRVETFLAAHPHLSCGVPAATPSAPGVLQPWERLDVPDELNGETGTFRAPRAHCTLSAPNDYAAVSAWIDRHEAATTRRAYTKEVERLLLWAVIERDKPLSSLTAEDATAYRAFLRAPSPRGRWIGPPRPRASGEWRPFAGSLSANSIKYALSVIGAMYRWLVEQGYLLANPFSGMKVRGATASKPLDAQRMFSQGEWALVRVIADGLEWSYGWRKDAAQRARFLLDFCYATGLRASEFTGAVLGNIEINDREEAWLHLVGKGAKPGRVAVPPLARAALDQYLIQRGLPVSPSRWDPATPVFARLDGEAPTALTPNRLWSIVKRFFENAADVLRTHNPALAEKLCRATPHWMRHTHATHALERGAELTTVRDNLRHASIGTTSTYLHSDEAKRSRELAGAFAAPSRLQSKPGKRLNV